MWFRILAIVAVAVSLAGVAFALFRGQQTPRDVPWSHVPRVAPHMDHSQLMVDSFDSGPAVTRACLKCHPNAAREVMQTSHWTWAGQKVIGVSTVNVQADQRKAGKQGSMSGMLDIYKAGTNKLPNRGEVIQVGKANLINNFCIHAGPNIEKCSSCHAGYGWHDNTFDFTSEKSQENVDCLVCHEQTGSYLKGNAGNPEKGVDLLAAAKSVARPTRKNCGDCHFKGGGGDAVKHGDLDGSMYFPKERIDVHMGKVGLQCVDCHRTHEHRIPGCGMTAGTEKLLRVDCTDCHNERPHRDDRLDSHTHAVACQTCHIPRMAIDAPTKVYWDWSEAGQEGRKEDPHEYLKIKGSFKYAQNVRPEYHWFNGRAYRYLTGEPIDPSHLVLINKPLGDLKDPKAKIWPFKVHRGKQIYDKVNKYLLTPKTWGPGGYWTDFDWNKACQLGAETTGLKYSGEYGFVETAMYWPLSHMVQPKEKALQCTDCHGEQSIISWHALGYESDPAFRGGRRLSESSGAGQGRSR